MNWIDLGLTLGKIIFFTFLVILPMVAYSVLAERRVSAAIQDRVGPNRVGIGGLLQPLVDGIKFLIKEDFTPGHVKKGYFWLAPALTMVPALLTLCVIPFGSSVTIAGREISFVIADVEAGPLFIFAFASLSVYGIVLAGWASNSKYPFLGGVRSSAQMISYELSMGLSLIPALLIFGHLNLSEIVHWQSENGWLLLPAWGEGIWWQKLLLWIPCLIAFVIFSVAIFAETNRMPFDLPECETELVAGYHTEYSSMKFALFFLGEYAAMIVGSALIVTLFLGGWSLPFGMDGWLKDAAGNWKAWAGFVHFAVFLAKVVCFILFFIWVRWTVPRFRFDQLMDLGWKVFFEVALVNALLVAFLLYLLA